MLYEPDSNLKSNTLASPISLPGAVSEFTPTLWSRKLNINVLPTPTVGDLKTLLSFNVGPVLYWKN